ncbi:hypothetical protein [Halomicrobium mukohataei]|uniref:Uncharacterized protein n=2 Tax=Halomicrobium mukohataei TaxID=57705 RepID=C7P546_HALMD|nr:hypothetical protein [Halomicrobium mukohataei]ACV49441.1 hypothetical protein Hmuk_3355 [Halomicrobium mukohataei DSM 12286]QCD67266.1 hypothetical protein E5139_16640 [Halomicrobium mukohataei]
MLLVLVSLGVTAWVARDSAPEVRGALANLRADTAVRLALFRWGVPIVVIVTVYLLALGFGLPWVAGLALSFAAEIIARGVYMLFRRLRYRVSQWENQETTPSQVQIRAYQLDTADDEVRYYADVNAVQLAHEDPDALTDTVCRVAGDLFERGETDPSVARSFATDLLRYGIVDVDETRSRLAKTAQEEAEGRMPADAETIERRVLERVPEPIWEETKAEKLIRRGKWSKRDGRPVSRG